MNTTTPEKNTRERTLGRGTSSSDLGSLLEKMQPLLLLLTFLLTSKAEADKTWKQCGGFLVREDFVLTAAHCWGSLMTVTLGAHNIKKKERTQQIIPVREIIRPSGYTSETFLNDIMLLQLSKKARLDASVRPIKLPKRNVRVRPGTVCSVAGWGQFRMDSSSGAEKLHEVELEIQKDEQCMSHYNHLYNPATQMCVGNPRRKKSALQGDSGGPLVCNNVAQGIVSCVKHCGTPPLVYTRISGFMHWIEKIMRHFSPPGPDSDASRINPSTFSGAEARTALGKEGGEEAARDLINFHL
ncbi:cathepsin G-like isoform X2 [Acinonyx jubatus]|uniref:Cathepsin G-like isoform X2 n=1 Tax=Acinonyx jubatus TaxID=32536 RepID=A0A6J1ZXH6_ACIJB|nr:cathepsin G-like isoform X2 [Acinonyx jubatus]